MIKYFFITFLLTLNLCSSSDIMSSDIENLKNNGVQITIGNRGNMQNIPTEMSRNPKEFLKITGLDFNGLNLSTGLPGWIGRLKNLNELNLQGTNIRLKELEKIKTLHKLTKLNLNENPNLFINQGNAKDLSQILNYFEYLSHLYLSNTNGKALNYNAIGNSNPRLTVLTLSSNRISSHLRKLYLEDLNLKELDLSDNPLSHLNVSDLPIKTLVKLDLSNTNLKKFNYPNNVSSDKVFSLLTFLNLSGNDSIVIDSKYKSLSVLNKLRREGKVSPNSLASKFKVTQSIREDSTSTSNQSKLTEAFIDGIIIALTNIQSTSINDNINIPYDKCVLTVASRKTIKEVRKYINTELPIDFNKNKVQVYLSKNSWYAITLGLINKNISQSLLEELKEDELIPYDSICSNGENYIKGINF